MKIGLITATIVLIIIIIIRIAVPNDKVRIARIIDKGRKALEQEDIDRLMSVISISYRDEYGMAYLQIKGIFTDLFANLDGIRAGCDVKDIKINGDTAYVAIDVWVTGKADGQNYRVAGDNTNPERMSLRMTKGEFKWAVISFGWQGVYSPEMIFDRYPAK